MGWGTVAVALGFSTVQLAVTEAAMVDKRHLPRAGGFLGMNYGQGSGDV